MAYSADLRKRVLSFIERGGSKVDAARLYEVHLRTVFLWVSAGPGYVRVKPGPRGSRKFDREALRVMLERQPDLLLKELAERFGVTINTISHALIKMGISRKKNTTVRSGLRGSALRAP